MLALLQRVREARIVVDQQTIATIGPGLAALIGFHKDDQATQLPRMTERLLAYRMFADDEGRMNRSLKDIDADLLLIPQFTLAADTTRGLRANFGTAATSEVGRDLFEQLVQRCRAQYPRLEAGRFGADMQFHLVNDGPVNFLLHA